MQNFNSLILQLPSTFHHSSDHFSFPFWRIVKRFCNPSVKFSPFLWPYLPSTNFWRIVKDIVQPFGQVVTFSLTIHPSNFQLPTWNDYKTFNSLLNYANHLPITAAIDIHCRKLSHFLPPSPSVRISSGSYPLTPESTSCKFFLPGDSDKILAETLKRMSCLNPSFPGDYWCQAREIVVLWSWCVSKESTRGRGLSEIRRENLPLTFIWREQRENATRKEAPIAWIDWISVLSWYCLFNTPCGRNVFPLVKILWRTTNSVEVLKIGYALTFETVSGNDQKW